MFTDLSHVVVDAARVQSWPSGADATSLDANGWPTAPNGGDTALKYQFQPDEAAWQVALTFTPGAVATMVAEQNCTINSFNGAAGTALVTPSIGQPTTAGWAVRVTFNGGQHITSLTAKRVGDSSTYSANFVAQMAAFVNGGPIRPLVMLQLSNGGGSNYGNTTAWMGGTKASPTRAPTLTNRSTANGNWIYNEAGRKSDTVAFETLVDMANAVSGGNLWHNIPWNAEDALIDFYADYAAANLTGTYYAEVANEVWNGGFNVYAQAVREARNAMLPNLGGSNTFTGSISGTALTTTGSPALTSGTLIGGNVIDGTTITGGSGNSWTVNLSQTVASQGMMANPGGAGERYCQRVAEVQTRIKARFVLAGKTNYKRVFAWQNAGAGPAAALLDYAPTGFSATSNYVDVYAVAPYFGNDTVPSSSTDAAAIIEDGYASIDNGLAYAEAILPVLAARTNDRGNHAELAFYEWGQSFTSTVSHEATLASVMNSPSLYKLYHYAADQALARCGNITVCHFENCGGGGTGNYGWGAALQSKLGITEQRSMALQDINLGKKKLQTLKGTLSAVAGSSAGTVIGTVTRRTMGSTPTLSSAAVEFVDPAARILQVRIVNAVAFAAGGAFPLTISESHSGDVSGPVVTDLGFTILPSQAVLTGSTGASKSSHLTVSGTPNLTFTGDGATPTAQMLVRASRAAATSKFQFEVTITSSNNAEIDIGIDNGSMDFSLDAGFPGRTDSSGIYIKLLSSGYVAGWAADTQVGHDTAQTNYWPAGTVLTVEVDTVAHTMKLYRNGVLMNETLGFGVAGKSSFTGIPALSSFWAFGGVYNNTSGATFNFGASAFTHALSAGFAGYNG